jgi:hypothetical protein
MKKANSISQVNKAIHEVYPLVNLIKGDGYFYIYSDDDATSIKIARLFISSIAVYKIGDMTIDQWVESVKLLLNEGK